MKIQFAEIAAHNCGLKPGFGAWMELEPLGDVSSLFGVVSLRVGQDQEMRIEMTAFDIDELAPFEVLSFQQWRERYARHSLPMGHGQYRSYVLERIILKQALSLQCQFHEVGNGEMRFGTKIGDSILLQGKSSRIVMDRFFLFPQVVSAK